MAYAAEVAGFFADNFRGGNDWEGKNLPRVYPVKKATLIHKTIGIGTASYPDKKLFTDIKDSRE